MLAGKESAELEISLRRSSRQGCRGALLPIGNTDNRQCRVRGFREVNGLVRQR